MTEEKGSQKAPRLGLAGAGLPAVDKAKAGEGVEVEIPSGRLKGVRMVVRSSGGQNPHVQPFMERWAAGEFEEVIAKRVRGEDGGKVDESAVHSAAFRATLTPEYAAHVLIADLPDPIAIPDHVDDVEDMPPSLHDHYMPDESGDGFRRKKNKPAEVGYTPDRGAWLVERYPELRDWARIFGNREERFLEERIEIEGNT